MAKGTFLAHNVAWAVLGEKMNHRSQASANSNSGAWPFSATAASSASNYAPPPPLLGCAGDSLIVRRQRFAYGTPPIVADAFRAGDNSYNLWQENLSPMLHRAMSVTRLIVAALALTCGVVSAQDTADNKEVLGRWIKAIWQEHDRDYIKANATADFPVKNYEAWFDSITTTYPTPASKSCTCSQKVTRLRYAGNLLVPAL